MIDGLFSNSRKQPDKVTKNRAFDEQIVNPARHFMI